ncbi:MAG: BON domain-containing protein [Planctomycetota bacterium]
MPTFIRLTAAFLVVALVQASASAQTTDQGTGTGTTDGGNEGSVFNPGEVDSSAFEQIDRGTSIGSSTTQGFGLTAEANGGGGGGANSFFGGGGGGGFGGLGGLFGGLGNAFGGQGNASQQPVLRVRLKSAVEVDLPSPAQRQQSASNLLSRVPARSGVRGVQVAMDGRTAVLSGNVKSNRERRMAELLMTLEPGIRGVENRINVGQ